MTRWFAYVGGLLASVAAGASEPNREPSESVGHVQVKAEEGVWVELAGFGLAVVEDTEGAVFRDIPIGSHRIVARREGFLPRHAVIEVHPGRVALHRIHGWQPEGSPPPGEGSGALVVRTFPVDATIKASRLGWERIEKSDAPFVASGIPVGRHKLTFCNAYKCIDYHAKIVANRVTSLFVDFELGEVHDRSKQDALRQKRETRDCTKTKDLAACKSACTLEAALGTPGAACAALGQDATVTLQRSLGHPTIPASRTRLSAP